MGADGVFRNVYGDPAAIFGKTAAELAGRPVAEVLDSESAVLWKSRFTRALAGDLLLLRERHSGATWYMGVFPIRVEGHILFAGGLASEVTPFSTAEQELRYTVLGALKAQAYERSVAAHFLHDMVGQNLTALGLQLDLVRMDLESRQPETCRRIAGDAKCARVHDGGSARVQLRAEPLGRGARRAAARPGPPGGAHP